MALDERARHQLFLRLEEHLGPEAATILMEHLPPTGWADVATKRDIDHLAEITGLRIERCAEELRAELHKALTEQTRTVVLTAAVANAGAVIAVAGLAFAAARLS
jgi:hypothetical protein